MTLGPWYLVTPKLTEAPLILIARLLLAVVALQVVLFAVWVATGAGPVGSTPFGVLVGQWAFFVWCRLIIGLVFPLVVSWAAVQTARSVDGVGDGAALHQRRTIAAGTILAAGLYFGAGLLVCGGSVRSGVAARVRVRLFAMQRAWRERGRFRSSCQPARRSRTRGRRSSRSIHGSRRAGRRSGSRSTRSTPMRTRRSVTATSSRVRRSAAARSPAERGAADLEVREHLRHVDPPELGDRLATDADGAIVGSSAGRDLAGDGGSGPGGGGRAALAGRGGPGHRRTRRWRSRPRRIADEIAERFGVERVAIVHRPASALGEVSVAVVAVSPHRTRRSRRPLRDRRDEGPGAHLEGRALRRRPRLIGEPARSGLGGGDHGADGRR
jgi:hypothetical protein